MEEIWEIEKAVKETKGGVMQKKEALSSIPTHNKSIDSAAALQLFLDHVHLSSIPGIAHHSVLKVKTTDSVGDVIRLLYEKKVCGAVITDDDLDSPLSKGNTGFVEHYVGFIDLASVVLWLCIKEFDCGSDKVEANGFFSMLEANPQVAQKKITELAKSFLWDPFLPAHQSDSLFHVLLLLANHPVHVVPLMDNFNMEVIGFVPQNVVIHQLLQSSGLDWFDRIAERALSEYGNNRHAIQIYEDQSISNAFKILWENRTPAIAVVQRDSKRLIGCIRRSDIYRLIENNNLYENRKNTTVEQFIQLETSEGLIQSSSSSSSENLDYQNSSLPRMTCPVTNKRTDTLKQVMQNVVATRSNFSFIVDEQHRVCGMITLRDIIIHFAPPCMDSRIDGGAFFRNALEQVGKSP